MAIDTYTALKSAVQTYAARPDSVFGNMVPTFVELVEARLYDGSGNPGEDLYTPPLRSGVMEVSGSIALSDGVGSLPANALEIRKLYADDRKMGITYQPPERFDELDANASAGVPVYYTVDAGQIKVAPGFTGDLLATYYCRYDAIGPSNLTGTLIAAHGSIYLEGCLFEGFAFMQDAELALAHLQKMRALVIGANRTAGDLRAPGPKRVRPRGLYFP